MSDRTTETVIAGVRLSLTMGDITRQDTDAIVNAANSSLMGGGGVDGAIHRVGGPVILEECRRIVARQGRLPAGKAVVTSGGNLKARFVIHTVGPVWHGGRNGEAEILAGAYRESLAAAAARGLKSVSFPSISTGAYGYPVNAAAEIAIGTTISFLKKDPGPVREVVFVLFNRTTFDSYAAALGKMAG